MADFLVPLIPYFHCHHAMVLLEFHSENYYELRLREIRNVKGAYEPSWKTALRERLFKPVKGPLPFPSPLTMKDLRDIQDIQELYKEEIDALHAIECPDCPWDGKTIFPEKKGLQHDP